MSKIGLAAGATAALVIGLSTSAQAATGTLGFSEVDGDKLQYIDPPDNVCVALPYPVDKVDNGTDKTALLYLGSDCEHFAMSVDAGRSVSNLSQLPVSAGIESVQFTD
ncbi:hypothetical protein [Nocardia tenerifensis]|nr:hypothetical protein [Nocardia tenerifensis]